MALTNILVFLAIVSCGLLMYMHWSDKTRSHVSDKDCFHLFVNVAPCDVSRRCSHEMHIEKNAKVVFGLVRSDVQCLRIFIIVFFS